MIHYYYHYWQMYGVLSTDLSDTAIRNQITEYPVTDTEACKPKKARGDFIRLFESSHNYYH